MEGTADIQIKQWYRVVSEWWRNHNLTYYVSFWAGMIVLIACLGFCVYKIVDNTPTDKTKERISNHMSYMMFDEHEYVLYYAGDGERISITHSPKCRCIGNK